MAVATTAARERAPSARESVRCVMLALVLLGAALPLGVAAQKSVVSTPPALRPLLDKVSGYLSTYEQKLPAVVATERYVQDVRLAPRTLSNVGAPTHRELQSDLLLMNLGAGNWVEFRDVYEVDRRPVRDRNARLQELFLRPTSGAFLGAQRIADESARYNLGIPRNINVPTMALAYLTAANQPRSVFTDAGKSTDNGVPVELLAFRETASPTVIRDDGIDVFASGRFWVDTASGAVRRSELSWAVTLTQTFSGNVQVNYGTAPGVAFLVPTSMDETYRKAGGEVDSGHATYGDVRTFEVDVKAIGRGGGGGTGAR